MDQVIFGSTVIFAVFLIVRGFCGYKPFESTNARMKRVLRTPEKR